MNDLLLMCMVAGRRAAIPAIRVQSVIEIEDITPIPGAPAFIRGLTALRSQALWTTRATHRVLAWWSKLDVLSLSVSVVAA